MRSRFLIGSVCAVLLLVVAGTCRQRSSSSQSATSSTEQLPTTAPESVTNPASLPTTDSAADGQETRSTHSDNRPSLEGQIAVLMADDPDSVINVRSLPSPESDPIGLGRVGEQVILGRSEPAEDGYTWYYVTFPGTSTMGWVREDLIDLPAVDPDAKPTAKAKLRAAPNNDVLKQVLNEQCGDMRAIEAYFVTPSHTIYVCKVRNKRLYLSQESGTQQVVTANEVEALGGGYIIGNGNFEYRLDSASFVVVRFDDSGRQEEVLRESVVYTERY